MDQQTRVDGKTRREQIARAALKIVGESGIRGLTTAALAREVGISEAALYRHFGSKDEILLAAVDRIGDGLREKMGELMNSVLPCREKIRLNFIYNLEHIEKNIGIPRLVFSDQIHIDNEQLRQKLLGNINGHLSRIESMIRSCQKGGTVRAELDPKATAMMLLGMIQTLAMRWSLSGFSFSLVEAGKEIWENYEKCIAACDEKKC